jgi:cyclopropane fatty-acyl-phospholipid synthase-like methyltransferase
MIYTSGIYRDEKETLEVAQDRKLETVCNQMQMKKGGEHLDIGCGWGTLIRFSAKNYGVNSTGVSLADEQKKWHEERCREEDVKNANFMVMDYREIPGRTNNKVYDYITCLEMAEHVGIQNFATFLIQVKNMLKDDGLFYLQIAGLRRTWQFEDLVWGIFMGRYIFPAADASCPLGFVVTHLERTGFEVHRVENCGVHYSLTIKAWYDNWVSNKDKIATSEYATDRDGKAKGEFWYRLWIIFLAWSAIIAAQGTSTVFMITCHKNHMNDKRSVEEGETTYFNRMVSKCIILYFD